MLNLTILRPHGALAAILILTTGALGLHLAMAAIPVLGGLAAITIAAAPVGGPSLNPVMAAAAIGRAGVGLVVAATALGLGLVLAAVITAMATSLGKRRRRDG